MDKICIVKRRQQYNQKKETSSMQMGDETKAPQGEFDPEKTLVIERKNVYTEEKQIEEFNDESQYVVSITMTEEQSKMLHSHQYIGQLLSGAKKDPALEIKRDSAGRIVFNYRFNKAPMVRMLRPDQVCQMLQISKSFLLKLVTEKKINSYKLGRLRRFLLEDILDYLLNSEEFSRVNDSV